MLKITFTPEFLEWVGQKMRANDTGLNTEEFAREFMHRAYVGRGAIMASASIAAENERLWTALEKADKALGVAEMYIKNRQAAHDVVAEARQIARAAIAKVGER